jgi:hypothetical protein
MQQPQWLPQYYAEVNKGSIRMQSLTTHLNDMGRQGMAAALDLRAGQEHRIGVRADGAGCLTPLGSPSSVGAGRCSSLLTPSLWAGHAHSAAAPGTASWTAGVPGTGCAWTRHESNR